MTGLEDGIKDLVAKPLDDEEAREKMGKIEEIEMVFGTEMAAIKGTTGVRVCPKSMQLSLKKG